LVALTTQVQGMEAQETAKKSSSVAAPELRASKASTHAPYADLSDSTVQANNLLATNPAFNRPERGQLKNDGNHSSRFSLPAAKAPQGSQVASSSQTNLSPSQTSKDSSKDIIDKLMALCDQHSTDERTHIIASIKQALIDSLPKNTTNTTISNNLKQHILDVLVDDLKRKIPDDHQNREGLIRMLDACANEVRSEYLGTANKTKVTSNDHGKTSSFTLLPTRRTGHSSSDTSNKSETRSDSAVKGSNSPPNPDDILSPKS
jgi:hypothetical protein